MVKNSTKGLNTKKLNQKDITKEVLLLLATGAVVLTAAMLAPGSTIKLFSKLGRYYRWQIKSLIKRLQKQKVIKMASGKFVLTSRGKQKVLVYKLKDIKIPKSKKWDEKWRVLIFDIPERQRFLRDVFRNTLREWDFYKLQKSVFVTPYSCEKEINDLCTESGLNSCVTLIMADSLGGQEGAVRKYFNL